MAEEEPTPRSGSPAEALGDTEEAPAEWSRNDDILGRANSPLRRRLSKLYKEIARGFEAQSDRADDQMDWWDCYNCLLGPKQFYNGTSQAYVPIIHDAIEARATRFANQLFPPSGRHVEVTPADGRQPSAILALVEHYIGATALKTQVIKPLIRNGDVEGQYNLYVDWNELTRHVVSKGQASLGISLGGATVEVPDDGEVLIEEELTDAAPGLEVLHDSDVLVLPVTAKSVEDALQKGGSVTIVRRWTQDQVRDLIDVGELNARDGEKLLDAMRDAMSADKPNRKSAEKELNEAAGIREKGRYVLAYETWTMLPLGDDGRYAEKGEKRLCRAYFGGDAREIGCKRNPFWNDRCPLLSASAVKIAGVFKGKSIIKAVAGLQYLANDWLNEGADSASYALMPIVMTDPEKNPRTNTMILNLAAIWEVDPQSTTFAQFPPLWRDAIQLIQTAMQQIFQSLGINPAMLPQQTGSPGRKRNQAEIALEQQVDILTTAEQVAVLEEGVLSPLMNRFVELDQQFRERPITIRMYGEMGLRAAMEEIEPIQIGTNYEFRWLGVEQARNMQQLQVQSAWLNVMRGLQPLLQQEGYQLRLGPAIEASAQSVFGPRIAPLVLQDKRAQLALDADIENELMEAGHDVPVHPFDDDPAHVKSHQQAIQQTGDPHGILRPHLARHLAQMQLKATAMLRQAGAASAQPNPQQGMPGGNGAGPRIGASPGAPRFQGPPGMVHADRMPLSMPRKM